MASGYVGKPTFDYTQTESWPIYGTIVSFATYNFKTLQLLVLYVDGSYVIVEGVPILVAPVTQGLVLGFVANNPTHS